MSNKMILGLDRRKFLLAGTAALAAPLIKAQPAFAITPDEIKKKGKIVIGIQGDNPPWGFVNSSGQQQGLDADIGLLEIARAGGRRLGAELRRRRGGERREHEGSEAPADRRHGG